MSKTTPYTTHNKITLISHTLCPFVQRAVIALKELGIGYQRIDINLNDKPDWFNALSPLGKVPVMVVDNDTVLFESAVIAEYVNDIGDGELLNSSPIDKARERAWIEFASASINDIGQLYSASSKDQFEKVTQTLNKKWALLENNLDMTTFFNGGAFSLVDAAFAPLFRYFDVLEQFSEFKFLNRYPRVIHWRKNLAQRTSVIDAVGQDYAQLLTIFVAARDSYLGQLAKDFQYQAV